MQLHYSISLDGWALEWSRFTVWGRGFESLQVDLWGGFQNHYFDFNWHVANWHVAARNPSGQM